VSPLPDHGFDSEWQSESASPSQTLFRFLVLPRGNFDRAKSEFTATIALVRLRRAFANARLVFARAQRAFTRTRRTFT
jgi:hypothetical protein